MPPRISWNHLHGSYRRKNLFSPLLLVYILLHTKELRQRRLSYSLMIVRLKIAGETLRGPFISGAVVPPVCQNLSSTVMHAHLCQMIVHHPNDTPLKTTNHSSSRETTTLSRVTLIKMVWSVGSVAGPLCSGEAKYTGQENTSVEALLVLFLVFVLTTKNKPVRPEGDILIYIIKVYNA